MLHKLKNLWLVVIKLLLGIWSVLGCLCVMMIFLKGRPTGLHNAHPSLLSVFNRIFSTLEKNN